METSPQISTPKKGLSTPVSKNESKKRSNGITPIGPRTKKNNLMSYCMYALELVAIFLKATGFKEENMRSLVYGIEYIIDDVHYFKIGSADLLHTIKTPLGPKTGRIGSSLTTLGKHFNKVRIAKIHFVINEDTLRSLFKLSIESYLLEKTQSYIVNPGEEKSLNLEEFRKMANIAEYYQHVEELCAEHKLSYAIAREQ